MTAKEVLQQAKETIFVNKKGDRRPITLLPPMSQEEISSLESSLTCRLPDEIRDLLLFARGFEGVLEEIDFSGQLDFECDLFPHGLPLAHDGCGNFWLTDLRPDESDTSVFYVCHDPPVIVFQADSIAQFIEELLLTGNSPWNSRINRVQEHFAMQIWANNPHVQTRQEALASDQDLRLFAESLEESFELIDLRKASLGDGFSWGRYGAQTICKRFREKRIFACQKRALNWFQKFFGV